MSIDPLRTYRRRVTTTWVVGLPLLGIAAWWTLRTPRVVVVPPPAPAALEVDALPSTSDDQSPVASPAAMADAFVAAAGQTDFTATRRYVDTPAETAGLVLALVALEAGLSRRSTRAQRGTPAGPQAAG